MQRCDPTGPTAPSQPLGTELAMLDHNLRPVTFLDALPRNATGKILERMLIQPG